MEGTSPPTVFPPQKIPSKPGIWSSHVFEGSLPSRSPHSYLSYARTSPWSDRRVSNAALANAISGHVLGTVQGATGLRATATVLRGSERLGGVSQRGL